MNLRTDIADYKENAFRRLHTIERFYQSLSLIQAIEYAASAADPEGKINPHQRRIGKKRLRQSAKILKKYTSEIIRAKSFADLFVVTEVIKEENRGLGDLWSYDTALRIAFNLGKSFKPQAVFVQAGVVEGVRKIFPKKRMGSRTLPVTIFPRPLQKLEPFEIENFLCVWGKMR
jgi:hypothetical protein